MIASKWGGALLAEILKTRVRLGTIFSSKALLKLRALQVGARPFGTEDGGLGV